MTNAETWIEREEVCYPHGRMCRRGRARLMRNPHNPIALPYGTVRAVVAGIPDTYFSIPARMRYKGRTVRGFLSHVYGTPEGELSFTPNAVSDREHSTDGTCCAADATAVRP